MSTPLWIGITPGVPVVADFMSTKGLGSPIIINNATKAAYYLTTANIVTPIATGGGGTVTGLATVATLAALNSVTGQVAGDARFLSEDKKQGLWEYLLGDYSARITADPQQGLFATASGIATTVGAWVRVWSEGANVQWFGAKGDDVTDDRPAFVGGLSALKVLSNHPTGDFSPTPQLYIPQPAKAYYLSAGLNIHQAIHIRGDGSGQPDAASGSLLRFAANVDCIVVNDYRTDGNTGTIGSNGLGGAGGTIIEGLAIWGGGAQSFGGPFTNPANNGTSRGIVCRTIDVKLIDLFIAFNNGGGLDIHATAGSTGATQGNANQFYCERVWTTYNGGDGMVVYGADGNAGTVVQCSSVSNAGSGFKEYSFLGNTWIQCHARDNGISDPTGNNNPTGTCIYLGVRYFVVAGQEAAASTTVPGTNSAVWRTYGNGYGGRTWVSGMTWVVGAPYVTNPSNSNCRNVFMGVYAELGQPPAQIFAPSLMLGGPLEDVGVDGTGGIAGAGAYLRSGSFGAVVVGSSSAAQGAGGGGYISLGSVCQSIFGGSGGGANNGTGNEIIYHTNGTDNFRIITNGTYTQRLDNNFFTAEQWGFASHTSGYGPFHHFIARMWIGAGDGGGAAGALRLGAAHVTSDMGALAIPQGMVMFQTAPVVGGPEKFICTAAGSSYSTATLVASGIVGGIQTATSADPAAITSSAGVNAAAAPTNAEFNALVAVVNAIRTDLAATRSALATLQANMRTSKQLAP